jgi:parvulin-like peptidyl-prolyl isomerase
MGYGHDPRVRDRMRDVERDLVVDVFLQDELNMQAFISEAEIEAYHADNQDAFRRAEDEVRFMAIWVPERAMAERVRTGIREGATFDEAAADSSIEVIGIELGEQFYPREELEAGVGETAFTLAPGAVSRVVPLEGQFLVLRVEDRQEEGTVRALWEVRDDIEARLAADLRESKLESMLTELLQRNDVSLNVDGAFRALRDPRNPRQGRE